MNMIKTPTAPPSPYSSAAARSAIERHTLSVLVDNEPGVLARVVGSAPSTCQIGLVGCRRLAVGIGFIANPCHRFRPRSGIFGSWKLYARRQ